LNIGDTGAEMIDSDRQEEVYDYFRTAEVDSIQEALHELGEDDYTYEDVQLMRIKFMSELGNNPPKYMIQQYLPAIQHGNSSRFFLMAGPCAIEGEEMAMRIAERIVKITDKFEIPYIFKGSYRKANRSRADSFTGIGD